MRTAFEYEGEIRGVDLLACLVTLWRENASGSLQFSRSGATAGFEIVGGEVAATSTSDPRFETAAILVVSEFEHRRAVYIQRSPIFGFPDIVMVEFVALGPERSSVAVYSRSRHGG